MGDLRDLAKSMVLTAKAVESNSHVCVKEVSKVVGTTVVYSTPVDTSRARMNWQGSVDTPKEGVLLPSPSQPASPSDGPRVAIESINHAADAYNGQTGGVWIANNLDYIQALNDGWSEQAPANFVALAVQAGVNAVSKVKLLP